MVSFERHIHRSNAFNYQPAANASTTVQRGFLHFGSYWNARTFRDTTQSHS